jgi:hypothetical protein
VYRETAQRSRCFTLITERAPSVRVGTDSWYLRFWKQERMLQGRRRYGTPILAGIQPKGR